MILYRPVGLFEYRLIKESGFTKFPPRLFWQPIFYPVLTIEYAKKIALDWNTKDEASGYIGYVTKFVVLDEYISKYEIHVVGNSECQELWIPSDELEEFNKEIQGKIEIVSTFKGEKYSENTKMPEMLYKERDVK